nr:sigma-54 factor interaction domain-containing protein [Marinicella sp. W31]MDC2875920.1 sigma-54 factor interaction domain-containing protein [Marinicella sp. W31]
MAADGQSAQPDRALCWPRLRRAAGGETGTGKELAARALHRLSPRKAKAFIAENCAAIPESLMESELFGYEKGAFTGADAAREGLIKRADGGTLFLDEIGDLPPALQAKLLRVLQERKLRPLGADIEHDVDFRLITATHCDIKAAIGEEPSAPIFITASLSLRSSFRHCVNARAISPISPNISSPRLQLAKTSR